MRIRAALLALAVGVGAAVAALADGFPSRPIRVIVGPSPDTTARIYGERIGRALGQPVVVETRSGFRSDRPI